MIFLLEEEKRLYIRPEALYKISKYKQINIRDKEAGGILIGRILLEDGNYIIDDVSEPYNTDKRKRTRFNRNVEGHQNYFNAIWEENNGRCFYLGEWHTHPEKVPNPSYVDLKDWKRLLSLDFESQRLFFLILGTDELKIWSGKIGTNNVIELKRG